MARLPARADADTLGVPDLAAQLGVAERLRKPATWILIAGFLAALALLRSRWPLHGPAHELIEEVGALLIGACIVGRLFCTLYISGRKNGRLERGGPYSIVRNPLYVFSLAGAAGVGMSSGSLLLGLTFSMGYFVVLHAAVLCEERRLLARFGDEYGVYLREVPRWLPAFALWRDPSELAVDPSLVRRRILEAVGLLLAIPLVEALEQLRELGMLPAVFDLP